MRKSKSPIYLIRSGSRELHEEQRGTRGRGHKSRDSRSSSSGSGSNDRFGRRSNTRMEKQSRRYSEHGSRASERLHGRIPRRYLRTGSRSLSRGRRSSSSRSPDLRIPSRRYSRDHSSEKRSLRRTSTNSEEIPSLWTKALQKAESSKTNLGQDSQKGKSSHIASAAGTKLKPKASGKLRSTPENNDPVELISDKSEEETMLNIMGFSGFDSTKGKLVEGNDASGLPPPATTRKYRQYMNRKGGFNRPLDFTN